MDLDLIWTSLLLALVTASLASIVYNVYFHPLSSFPGPWAARATPYYKAYVEVVAGRSFAHTLEALHDRYGDVVRVSPRELHFRAPSVYHEIYNPHRRWDKEESLYHSFGEDRSSFGYLRYAEAKDRKDILARTFSKRAIVDAQHLIREKVLALCESMEKQRDSSVDLFYAYRCMSMDVITSLSFGNSVDAVHAPDHRAPIILAMDASLPVFVRFKHAAWYRAMIMNCPPRLSRIISPETAGLVDLQQLLKAQIASVTQDPDALRALPHNTTIYHQLLDSANYRDGRVPEPGSLYEESQALMFGGADTTGNTLMHGSFHILSDPAVYHALRQELLTAWPDVAHHPTWQELEQLPYLTAVIKESMRISPGVASPLPRVVPAEGATLDGHRIPGGTVVGISSHFVHQNATVFPDPGAFRPQRWLDPASSSGLEKWLVNFSRGPRSCLGLNLAWAELYLTFAYVFRRFELEMDASSPAELQWRDCFLPEYHGPHLRAKMTPVRE